MKKTLWRQAKLLGGVAAGLCFAVSAYAIPAATVGGLDSIYAQTTLPNSGEATEEAWVSGVLGFTVDLQYKLDAGLSWQEVDGTDDWWAQELNNSPEWFLLKLGTGSSGADTHYLYENMSELNYAVIDFSVLNDAAVGLTFNIGRISHVSVFCEEGDNCEPPPPCQVDCEPPCEVDCEPPCEEDCTPVPEPDIAFLMLLGFAGLAGQRLIKKAA